MKETADILGKDWKMIAKLLGLDKNDVLKIEDSSGENAFAGVISHWRKRNGDRPLSFDVLLTELCQSTEYSGKEEHLTTIILQILGKT